MDIFRYAVIKRGAPYHIIGCTGTTSAMTALHQMTIHDFWFGELDDDGCAARPQRPVVQCQPATDESVAPALAPGWNWPWRRT